MAPSYHIIFFRWRPGNNLALFDLVNSKTLPPSINSSSWSWTIQTKKRTFFDLHIVDLTTIDGPWAEARTAHASSISVKKKGCRWARADGPFIIGWPPCSCIIALQSGYLTCRMSNGLANQYNKQHLTWTQCMQCKSNPRQVDACVGWRRRSNGSNQAMRRGWARPAKRPGTRPTIRSTALHALLYWSMFVPTVGSNDSVNELR